MASTPFKDVSWSDNEPIYMDKLNAMTNNDRFLFENTPRAYYVGLDSRVKKTSGVKILTGIAYISGNKTIGNSTTVYFGSYFAAGCRPTVVASVNSSPQGRIFMWTRGIGTLFPDNRGFEVRINAGEVDPKNNKLRNSVYIHYIAIGY